MGRHGAPGVVLAAADDDVADAREGRASRVDPAAVHVELEQELGPVEADLRAGDEDRVLADRLLRRDEERVAHARRTVLRQLRAAGLERLEAPVVDHRVSGHGRAGRLAVGKRAGHGDRRLGILHLAELVPDLTSFGGAQLVLQRVQVFGAAHLVAARDAEDPSDQRGRGDEVVAVPRRDLQAGLLDVGVHARDERVDVRDDRPSLRALALQDLVLGGEKVLGLLAGDEDPSGQGQAERVQAGHVQSGDARGAANELHQQVPVLSGHEARPEHHVRPRLAGDVRDIPLVPDDLQSLPAGVLDPLRLALEPERLGLEEAVDVRGADGVPERRQRVVEGELVGRVRAAVRRLPRRQDVEGDRGVVLRRLRARRRGHERRHRERHEGEGDQEGTQLHQRIASLQLAVAFEQCDPRGVSRLGIFAAAGALAVTRALAARPRRLPAALAHALATIAR